jgi:RNA polymerase sigma factor (TIGR02999 family)
MNDVTRILSAIEQGDPRAAGGLLPLVYDELRKLAARRLAQEKPGQTLQATALVHEAYLRLVGGEDPGWDGRGHFFAAAAEAMRRILVENARRKRAEKHGGGLERRDLDEVEIAAGVRSEDLLALDEALTRLAAHDPTKADLVKLRCFAGLSVEEAARSLGISRATADLYWHYAKVWLFCELRGTEPPGPEISRREAPGRAFALPGGTRDDRGPWHASIAPSIDEIFFAALEPRARARAAYLGEVCGPIPTCGVASSACRGQPARRHFLEPRPPPT